jgi:hypothetical protein
VNILELNEIIAYICTFLAFSIVHTNHEQVNGKVMAMKAFLKTKVRPDNQMWNVQKVSNYFIRRESLHSYNYFM